MHVYDYAIKHIILILLASAGLACADDLDTYREQQETQRFIDQIELQDEIRSLRHDIEEQQQHMRWEAQEREAREQQHYGW